MTCVRCVVSGRVQGVFFRASARQQAVTLGVSGYARNLPDGRVEVVACGREQDVNVLRDWLQVGPPAARVDAVDCEPVDLPLIPGFRVE
ncbi:MAG: acylphosphatase [Chromatiales bacterium 21-64-14]|nr:MAG: acylphosphatase [Chromatiales bacterium 21-64-14]HQU14795.1 acylphosphatase [Gammaproteobacteria bacterium]